MRTILDASAVLALLNAEPGAAAVESRLASAVISTVNLAEVESKLADCGMTSTDIRTVIDALALEPLTFELEMARQTGRLRPLTRALGLSLGDRACLATAVVTGLPVLTADRTWTSLDLGVSIETIR